MPTDVDQPNGASLPDHSSEQWLALLWLMFGALCLVLPAITTFSIETVLAGILFIAAGAKCVLTLLNLRAPHSALLFAGGFVVALLAALRVFFPVHEFLSFSALLGVFFLLQGLLAFRLAYRQQHRVSESARDLVANGVVNIFLAAFFTFGWIQPASWVPGILLGASMISLSLAIWRQAAVD